MFGIEIHFFKKDHQQLRGIHEQNLESDIVRNADGYTQAEYEQYKQTIDNLAQVSQDSWDKHVLSLSSAGMGLSLIVLKDVAGERRDYITLMIIAWALWGVSILISLLSFVTATKNFEKISKKISMQKWQTAPKNFFADITSASFLDKCTGLCNALSFICFISAVICFIIYTSLNFNIS